MKKNEQANQLLQTLANATKTYYDCFGHHKDNMNKSIIDDCVIRLKKLGKEIPTDEELLKVGVYNGEGAF